MTNRNPWLSSCDAGQRLSRDRAGTRSHFELTRGDVDMFEVVLGGMPIMENLTRYIIRVYFSQ
jgi:hypothetical protein